MSTQPLVPRRRRSGFALLITITLLAFLVLLLVSLSVLTKVETQVADNTQNLSKARQNALMALNIALGQLQSTMGADQRVSAPASQKGDGTANYSAADFDNNSHWIGVYRQDPATPGTSSPQLLTWLVSGNEKPTFDTTTATTPVRQPNAAVNALNASTSPDTQNLTLNGDAAVLLVGSGSTKAPSSAADPDQFVVAPSVSITVPASSVPGIDPSAADPVVGHYAYWIGDEGMKAKVNLSDPWTAASGGTLNATTPPTSATRSERYAFVTSQRMGIEAVATSAGTALDDAYPAVTSPSSTTADNTAFNTRLTRVLELNQLPLSQNDAKLSDVIHSRFHDITTRSAGLLIDTVNGGFKKDLTTWIAGATSNPVSGNAADDFISPGDSADAVKFNLPKWQLIRDYAQLNTGGNAPALRTTTDSRQGFHPVLTYARMAYGITHPGGAVAAPIKINVMPMIVLWNPYNIPIPASDLEVSFGYTSFNQTNGVFSGKSSIALTLYPGTVKGGWFVLQTPNFGSVDYSGGNRYWRFKVHTNGLAAGESRVFTLSDADDDHLYSKAGATLTDALFDPVNSVYLPGPSMLASNFSLGTYLQEISSDSAAQYTRLEVFLTPQLPAGATDADIRNASYQASTTHHAYWAYETANINPLKPDNSSGATFMAHTLELTMSSSIIDSGNRTTSTPADVSGSPRWLAQLNPLYSSTLLRPPVPTPGGTYSPTYLRNFNYSAKPGSTGVAPDRPLPSPTAGTTVVSSGMNLNDNGQRAVIKEFLSADTPLASLAQLQHLNASTSNLSPTYAIGNSLSNLFVDRDKTFTTLTVSDQQSADAAAAFPDKNKFNRIYDTSYLLNKALWDGYFFSTLPTASGSALTAAQAIDPDYHLPNARYVFRWDGNTPTATQLSDVATVNKAALHLMVNGGFNINSTSVQAWRALLHRHNGPSTAEKHIFSRFSSPIAGATANNAWFGYRVLTDAQINSLADSIVNEIRKRGPFLSLSDFVNRKLEKSDKGISGALQAALDSATINNHAPFSTGTTTSNPVTDYYRSIVAPDNAEQKIVYTGSAVPASLSAPSNSRAAFAPGFLTQADVLTAIGPVISPRSDTFVIRTYGDATNPITNETQGRAWCEAIVQRYPDYVNTQPAEDPPAGLNVSLGRRFRVVSFRWLSRDEI